MKKIYNILVICNALLGLILLVFNYGIIKDGLFILLFLLLISFYTYNTIKCIMNKKSLVRYDIVITSIYFIFINIFFVLSIVIQGSNPSMFTLLYHSRFLIVPSIIYSLYNIK